MTAWFDSAWADLLPVGRVSSGGYRRFAYDAAESTCREWFTAAATGLGLAVETDRNGNLWAWWGEPGPGAVVVGSHLDSVPDGGAYDGPLGVATGFAAVCALRASVTTPVVPVAVVAFADEEGARFGVACAGSRLMTGALDPDRARGLRDADGVTMAEAMRAAGHDPTGMGRDDDRLSAIAAYVELHVEQGRALAGLDTPVGVGTGIWPHGRWRFTFDGAADHAGTTRLDDRRDPTLAHAAMVLGARDAARRHDGRATVGRVQVEPNATNAIPSRVTAWLDARAADPDTVAALVADVQSAAAAAAAAAAEGVTLSVAQESRSGSSTFDPHLTARVRAAVAGCNPSALLDTTVPALPTAAGHDAGVLADAGIPTAMVFVRNPTGVSHSPAERADTRDCHAGVTALTAVLADLAAR